MIIIGIENGTQYKQFQSAMKRWNKGTEIKVTSKKSTVKKYVTHQLVLKLTLACLDWTIELIWVEERYKYNALSS